MVVHSYVSSCNRKAHPWNACGTTIHRCLHGAGGQSWAQAELVCLARLPCPHCGRGVVVRQACLAVPLGALLRNVVGPHLQQAAGARAGTDAC